jgi:ATP:corrinoid adenosyltransferase
MARQQKGLLLINTGNGKGKTTVALGMAYTAATLIGGYNLLYALVELKIH